MNNQKKYACIHGHFYQPPRENAWLETVELQDSAAPFHDWNERINNECYAPNATARILDNEGSIIKIINNYAYISFNMGPTLLSWLKEADPETYQAILQADKLSLERYDGHGSALAQVHSHLILPLCNRRDKETQVIWGIEDFKSRFGRMPEGIWLAETATDTETLEVLAEQGIKFTILAPRQAKAVRQIGQDHWDQLGHATVDPRRPYLCKLPSGKEITLFFYDGNVSQGVAFEGLLNNGSAFAERIINTLDGGEYPQLAHIATDGESYGHHHRHGEMALASCLNHIEENTDVQLTNYGQYLELFPPTYEIQIHDNSSWSCVHGVERWRSNCGCNTGGPNSGTQEWRGPLRDTLDWLRDELIPIYEQEAGKFLKDVWATRNDYIQVILNRKPAQIDEFLAAHVIRPLDKREKTRVLRLLEMQRNALLMFTSCGWFFDEISGIETNQILQYANRAIYYANQVVSINYHQEFQERLKEAPSNVHENGAVSYQKNVIPKRVDLKRVGMHYAASSLFEKYPRQLELFNYIAESEVLDTLRAGNQRLSIGRTMVRSKVTHSEKFFSFAVLYLGQQNIIGNISLDMPGETFDKMREEITAAFRSTDLGQAIVVMENYFDEERFTIWHLFRDEKRKILQKITERNLKSAEAAFREIYNDNYQLMTGMLQSDIPVPQAYVSAVEFVVNKDLHNYFEQEFLFIRDLKRLIRELDKWNIQFSDRASFTLAAEKRLYYEMRKLASVDIPLESLKTMTTILEIIQTIEIELDIWKSQNLYFSTVKAFQKGKRRFVNDEWKETFMRLGELLSVKSEVLIK
ncbi:MAG: DUF3536 domain-containing protein [Saprospiraceae bacterium]